MKILVVSLLRIGDLLMQAPALKALRTQYPNARIDLLTNKQCGQVIPLLGMINQHYIFDREHLQKSLGANEVHLYQSYFALESLIHRVNNERYDLVLNWTHNKLSGLLVGALRATEKMGLEIKAGEVHVNGNWFRYLNQTESNRQNLFHYSDFFLNSLDLKRPVLTDCLRETDSGKSEYSKKTRGLSIGIQTLTADAKKNWPLSKYADVIKALASEFPTSTISLLCAQNEKDLLQEFLETSLSSVANQVELQCLSLAGAFSFLKSCDLLITGDTSIKHLASYANTHILELVLGSSQLHETGVYKENQWMVQNLEFCSPCEHKNPCGQKSHLCAERIKSCVISSLAISILKQQQPSFDQFQSEKNNVRISMSRRHQTTNTQSIWHYENQFDASFKPQHLVQNVDRSVWKFILSKDHKENAVTAEATHILQQLQNVLKIHNDQAFETFAIEQKRTEKAHAVMTACEKILALNFPKVQSAEKVFRIDPGLVSSMKEEIQKKLNSVSDLSGYTRSLQLALNTQSSPFVAVRRIADAISETKIRLNIRRQLLMQMIDIGGSHARENGKTTSRVN